MFSKPGTLAVVCLATAMLMLDIAVVNTALPHIARDLNAGLGGITVSVGDSELVTGTPRETMSCSVPEGLIVTSIRALSERTR